MLWPLIAKNWLTGKELDVGKDRRQEEKGTTEDETVGQHHWLNGHEFEQASGDGEGQGSLACCSPWRHRVGHDWATERQQSTPGHLSASPPTTQSFLCNILQHFLHGETHSLNTLNRETSSPGNPDPHASKTPPRYGRGSVSSWWTK